MKTLIGSVMLKTQWFTISLNSLNPRNPRSSALLRQSLRCHSKWVTENKENPGVISSTVDMKPTVGITIPEFLKQNLHKWESATAFECGITGKKYTHGELHRYGESFAASLQQHGLKRRDAVCVLLPNIPEYPIAALGIWNAGLVMSPINPSYTPDEVAKQINDCEGKTILTTFDLIPLVRAVMKKCPTLKSVIVVGDPVEGCHTFSEMLKTERSSAKILLGSELNTLEETALLPYSSGTTGLPKGVELTPSSFTTNLLQATYPGYMNTNFFDDGNTQERFIAILPFFHMYGLLIVMSNTIFQGTHTLCLPKFHPETFVKALKKHKPTTLHLVTPIINFIISCNNITKEDLRHTKGIIAGAAPIGHTLIEKFLAKADKYILFQEGFGMTEVSAVSHVIPPEVKNSKAGSSGILAPGMKSKIVNPDTGETVGRNVPGEIYLKGPNVMKGYYKNEAATKETIDSDGYLRTGDLGYYDDDYFLVIVDRIKDLIKVKGLQVAPGELEDVLRSHPKVADVAVIGVRHERLGEAPRAYIVPKNKSLTDESIKMFVKGKVAQHKQLAGGVEFISEIPKAASGKILRRKLVERYRSSNPN